MARIVLGFVAGAALAFVVTVYSFGIFKDGRLKPTMIGAEYSVYTKYAIEQIRYLGVDGKPEIGGSAVGYEGEPHPFYSMHYYLLERATDDDLLLMIEDENPAVRVMGALCIIKSRRTRIDEGVLARLDSDDELISCSPRGSVFGPHRVSDIVARFRRDPDFFEQ